MGGWRLAKSKWANPHSIKSAGSVSKAVRLYEGVIPGTFYATLYLTWLFD